MARSLFAKLAVGLAVILALVGAGFLYLTVRTSQLYEQEVQQRLHRDLAAHIADVYPLLKDGAVDEVSLKTLFEELMHVNPAIEVYLLDPGGTILAFSAPDGHVVRRRVSLAPVQRFLDGDGEGGPVLGDDPRSDQRKVFSAAPVLADGVLHGYAYVVLAGEAYAGVAGGLGRSYMLRLAAWVVVGVVLLSVTAGAVMFYRLTRPLAALERDVRKFAAGLDGDAREERPPGDEIGGLERSFRRMSDRIGRQVDALAAADRSRRELVANVSHDLRTPLAHMTGYLETLRLRWDTLTAGERTEYLEVAVRHGERLSGLVDELFEISRLDSIDDLVRRETFPVDELVRDVARRYRLAAERRGIALTAEVPRGRCQVNGDPQLIERSLVNLLDNAMRHTPDGGQVEVLARRRPGTVQISVRDTGGGIPLEHQGRIFERFYRGAADSSGRSGGLGLAITKRAIELHQGEIDFSSAQGEGTTFRVSLPTV